jgi:sugar phosphate isomerase/epimerase
MRFSVGQYTTPRLSFAEDLAVYREAGAEGIGIDLGLKPLNPVDDLARLRESGLTATACLARVSSIVAGTWSRGPTEPLERIDAACAGVHELAPFEPACCVFSPGPLRPGSPAAAWRWAVDGLRAVAREAASLGLRVAIEPLHPTLAPDWTFLTDLGRTVALMDEIDEANVGFLFDVWHLWDGPDSHELLRENLDRLFAVHIDDWRQETRSWADRVLPGEGIADVVGFLRILREGGYDGWLELEIFSDDGLVETAFPDSLWARDPVELIREARERTARLWAAAAA